MIILGMPPRLILRLIPLPLRHEKVPDAHPVPARPARPKHGIPRALLHPASIHPARHGRHACPKHQRERQARKKHEHPPHPAEDLQNHHQQEQDARENHHVGRGVDVGC